MRNVLVDVILFALFVAVLSFHHLPKILHEVLGVALAVAIIFHVVLNRRRLVSLVKKPSPRKLFSLTINLALLICAVVILIAGVCMSNYLFVDAVSFELQRNMTIHQLHVALPYVLMILIGVHLGLNWREFWQRLLHTLGAEDFYRERQKIFMAAAVTLSAIGAAGLYLNRVNDRILMKHIFATLATELHAVLFMLMIVGGVIFFALITFLLNEKIFKRRRT